MTIRWTRCCAALGMFVALLASPLLAATDAAPKLLHVPANLFAAGGPLASLEIESCRIVLADGPGGSQLIVSPAMARMGFRDIPFTVPPLEQKVEFGPLSTTLRLKIPGRDPADPSTTIQSTRATTRVAGASIELTVVFERKGPEMIGEYYGLDPHTGKDGWVHALDVEADDLTITVSLPIEARGAALGLGTPKVTAGFSFSVTPTGGAGVALDGTFAKDMVKSAIESSLANALNLEAYREPLAASMTTWLSEGPFRDLQLREIRLLPAADGGLDIQAVTISDP